MYLDHFPSDKKPVISVFSLVKGYSFLLLHNLGDTTLKIHNRKHYSLSDIYM